MLQTLRTTIRAIWAIFTLTLGIWIGASYGYARHGVAGAIGLGFVGLCVGALAAACPADALDVLLSGL